VFYNIRSRTCPIRPCPACRLQPPTTATTTHLLLRRKFRLLVPRAAATSLPKSASPPAVQVQPCRGGNRQEPHRPPRIRVALFRWGAKTRRCFEAFSAACVLRLVYARRRRRPANPPELTNQPITCRDGTMPPCAAARGRFLFKQRGGSAPAHGTPEQSRAADSGRGPNGVAGSQESAKAFSAARRSRFPARTTSRSARGRG